MKDAIENLVNTLKELQQTWPGLEVKTQESEFGAALYRLTVILEDEENTYAIGDISSRNQGLTLRLDANTTDSLVLVDLMEQIDDKLREDPRRKNNIQTTVCPGWRKIRQSDGKSRFEESLILRKNKQGA